MTHPVYFLFWIPALAVLALFFWWRVRGATTRSDYLRRSDEKFLSQATDPNMRQKEIARLTRTRKYLSLAGIFLFLVLILSTRRGMDTDTLFGWVIGVMLLAMFSDVQNKLRLLLLAERMQSGSKPDV